MKSYIDLSKEERAELYRQLSLAYEDYKKRGLNLDISRGKPNSIQLDISQGIMSVEMTRERCFTEAGFDCRNYGILDGIPEMKRFIADAYGIDANDVVVGGNSSLALMYGVLTRAMLFGFYNSPKPWCREEKIKWLCVVPGYDRHFAITESFGFELISVKMNDEGPDMDEVERLVKDPAVKGIWCIPKYSNPSGNTYSDNTVRRLANMECAAPDFKIMWDNAYAVHDFDENGDVLLDIMTEARKAGTEDRVLYFGSTSKITFPGGGVAFFAAAENNKKYLLSHISKETIGYDKINQLRHLHFFGDAAGLKRHMLVLGQEIKKKFDIVLAALDGIKDLGIAKWTKPNGGYFVSLDMLPGTATRVYQLMKDAGVTLTNVGATYPYGKDPDDANLRLAPTYPTIEELTLASEILIVTVKLAALEKLGI